MVQTYSKEKLTAMKMLCDHWSTRNKSNCFNVITDSGGMFLTGFIGFSSNIIELKGTKKWRSNQSVTNIRFYIDENTSCLIHKLNARRKLANDVTPCYKVWLYDIFTHNDINPSLYFIWCERGEEPESFPIIDPATITLEDLAFLKPFVDPEIAAYFNW